MLKKEKILAFISTNRRTLEERYFVEKIALFGSCARDEQTEKSDIDLLVTLKKNTPDIHVVKSDLRAFFEQYFNCAVDIASEKYLKPYLRNEILAEAVYA
ncbi:MAG: nucleotidyltransferase domain-containing protein [Chitinivibrionales bacterium]|nr:nucleotidyltransferase domain-containing protein [Chitinivibrionales bacterium]